MTDILSPLAYLHGKPEAYGTFKQSADHFFVSETLSFIPAGQGEHFFVRIRKIGENTQYVANELAKACSVPSRNVSWAGLKDRHAVTEQWFSVHLPGKDDPDLTHFVDTHEGIDAVIETTRHDKKLRMGEIECNHFKLILSSLSDTSTLDSRLEAIKTQGVPNYFGNQRFGINGNNLTSARAWGKTKQRIKDKNKRSFYLSAARSHLFNLVLDSRIKNGTVTTPYAGDVLVNGEKQRLVDDTDQANVLMKNAAWRISGPMTGDNALPTRDEALAFEQAIVDKEPDLLSLIRDNRMQHDRRPLLLTPENMSWTIEADQVHLAFSLPTGSFATAVIREIIQNLSNGDNHAHSDQQ